MQALAEIRVAPVEIALNGAGQFASKTRVRAVWVGVEKSQGLLALHEKVDNVLGCRQRDENTRLMLRLVG